MDPEATVRRYYELIDGERYEELFALFAEDIEYARPGQDPIRGMDAFRAFYHEGRPLEDGRHEVIDVVIDDNRVAVRGTFTGRLAGEEVQFGFADFHVFDDEGTICRRFTYTDRDAV